MNTLPAISRFLTVTLGMAEDAIGQGAVSRAITAAMHQEGISDQKAYERLFVSSEAVRQRLTDAVVVGETWFFRDRGPFTSLSRHVRELRQTRLLKILSAPCATGEEPYSIAMTLFAAGLPPAAFVVDGVDISIEALNKARLACYGSGSFRGHIAADVARYFLETPQGRKVSDQVRGQVTFHHDNLVKPESLTGQGPYDIIFCRNLLIYLTPEARRKVFDRLDSLLLPGGLLFTGHTETIFWHQQGYLPRKWDRAFALTKPVSQPLQKTAETAKTKKLLPSADAEQKQPVLPVIVKTGLVETMMDDQIQKARLLADRGDLDGAVRLCQDYTRKVGPSAETYCLMGVIQMARHDINAALDFFLKAIYLDPGHYESLIHASLLYRQKGEKQKEVLYRERAERQTGTEKKTEEKRA